jgi:hypothetical protein
VSSTLVRRTLAAVAGPLAVTLALPESADAHGLVGRTDLPIPSWMFAWAAALVLILSFAALALLWPRPRLQQPRTRPLLRIPRIVQPLCGAIGVAIFGAVAYSALAGTQVPTSNLAPTFVYVVFWVAIPVTSALLGDIFQAFNPWRTIYRWLSSAATRLIPSLDTAPVPYPDRLGLWPAVAGIVAFGWLELVYADRDNPTTLGVLMLAFAAVQVIGMSVYGEERWTERADPFSVWFNLCSRLSVLQVRERQLELRPLLSGLPRLETVPGTVAMVCALIGITTFDGASNGPMWTESEPHVQRLFEALGFAPTSASELAFTVGLALCIAAVSLLYWLGIQGMRTVDPSRDPHELARLFAHTLVPIAFAYAFAHYFSLLVLQGQALGYLISDPLGDGSDLFGTAGGQIDYTVISTSLIWYVQVGALVAGHVAGLVLAHDRALTVFDRDAHAAVRSQYWMLTIMVSFTGLGLWLLSAVNV